MSGENSKTPIKRLDFYFEIQLRIFGGLFQMYSMGDMRGLVILFFKCFSLALAERELCIEHKMTIVYWRPSCPAFIAKGSEGRECLQFMVSGANVEPSQRRDNYMHYK